MPVSRVEAEMPIINTIVSEEAILWLAEHPSFEILETLKMVM
jgi:hypothetical protein